MEKYQAEEKSYPIWIDHTEEIIPFKRIEGVERMYFSSQKEKLAFAYQEILLRLSYPIRRDHGEALHKEKGVLLG